MKRQLWNGVMVLFALLMVMLISPGSARASIVYAFSGVNEGTGGGGDFTLSKPTYFTTTGTFAVSFTIGPTTFTNGYFDASSDCFAFSTSAISACATGGTSDLFFSFLPGATGVGTFLPTTSGCQAPGGQACEIVESLTITDTPEPSSLMLLGTGLLGFAGVVKRRVS